MPSVFLLVMQFTVALWSRLASVIVLSTAMVTLLTYTYNYTLKCYMLLGEAVPGAPP